MTKMEFELTDEQIEKVQQLESNGISVGEAIDQLFEIRNEALSQIEEVEKSIDFIDELKNTAIDADKKIEMIEKRYEEAGTTPDMKIQEIKHKISWGKDFFKF